MNRDDIELLRAANPVVGEQAYFGDEVRRRVADIVDPDRAVVRRAAPDRRRSWLIPALAAAVVLAVVVTSAIVFGRGTRSDVVADPGSSPVTCAVSTDGGRQAARDRTTRAEQVITTRVRGLGGTASQFVSDADTGTIGFAVRGVSPAAAAQACRVTTTAIRPLVLRPVRAATPRSADPLGSLTFAVPASETAYARLTSAQQVELATAVSRYDCSGQPATDRPALVCSDTGGETLVFLLAPRLVGGTDVTSATARAPSAGASVQWTVDLHLTPGAASRLAAYTSRNHAAGGTAVVSQCGPTKTVRCADFLAFTSGRAVTSVPLTNDTISTDLTVAGAFSQSSAETTAAEYTAASIGLRPV